MAADTVIGSDGHLKCKISQMEPKLAAWSCHHFLSLFGNSILPWVWENLLCVHGEKILCSICCSSSLLCQEADEGSDIALSVFWDSVVVKISYAQ